MIQEYNGNHPSIHQTSYIAPNACISGQVSLGAHCRVMHGAQIVAENNPITIGDYCIVLENAVLRAAGSNPLVIGDHCLIGPHAHLTSCTLENQVFVATGASVFHGATLQNGSEVRINGVVHVKSVLSQNAMVPIGWVAVGNPAQIFPPQEHEKIWAIQKEQGFNTHVYNYDPQSTKSAMQQITEAMGQRLGDGES